MGYVQPIPEFLRPKAKGRKRPIPMRRKIVRIMNYHKFDPDSENQDALDGKMWFSHFAYVKALKGEIEKGTPIEIVLGGENRRTGTIARHMVTYVGVDEDNLDTIFVEGFKDIYKEYDEQIFKSCGTRIFYG